MLGNRTNVAAPVLLVLVGIAFGFAPFAGHLEIDPELVLGGVLPPLLYATSVSMPSTNFRRDFGPIATLSVILVMTSAVVLGLVFWWLVPGLNLTWGIALGAIVSPSDAVATSILKNVGVSSRIQTILEGEGLLNDAPSLVVLRMAIVATAASVGFWQVAGGFLWAVLAAIVIGVLVGRVMLAVRQRITDRTVSTALSFAVPFAASVPTDLVGASGLVAAVSAGLVTGRRAVRVLPPFQLMADGQNWRTLEFVLEGSIFLFMGLQFHALLSDLRTSGSGGLLHIIALALLALVVVLLIRTAFVAPLLAAQQRRAERGQRIQPRLQQFSAIDKDDFEALSRRFEQGRRQGDPRTGAGAAPVVGDQSGTAEPTVRDSAVADTPDAADRTTAHPEPHDRRTRSQRRLGRRRGRRIQSVGFERFAQMVQRNLADVDYLLRSPMSWRDGAVIVWAGMRGAVTVAAAMTLPTDTPNRPVVLLLASVWPASRWWCRAPACRHSCAGSSPVVPRPPRNDGPRSRRCSRYWPMPSTRSPNWNPRPSQNPSGWRYCSTNAMPCSRRPTSGPSTPTYSRRR